MPPESAFMGQCAGMELKIQISIQMTAIMFALFVIKIVIIRVVLRIRLITMMPMSLCKSKIDGNFILSKVFRGIAT